jgi:hypothetical protein
MNTGRKIRELAMLAALIGSAEGLGDSIFNPSVSLAPEKTKRFKKGAVSNNTKTKRRKANKRSRKARRK